MKKDTKNSKPQVLGLPPSTTKREEMSQGAHYQASHQRMARANGTMLDLMYGPNPITRDELVALIRKRPEVYGKYAAHLKNLKRRAPRYTQARRSR